MKRALVGIVGLAVILGLIAIYHTSSADKSRDLLIATASVVYGLYVVLAAVGGYTVHMGAATVKGSDPKALRIVSAGIGMAYTLVGLYFLVKA